jgi:SagB-type dehydrogenase family enzyme
VSFSAKEPLEKIPALDYHRRTKHHFQRYARSPGYMDWRNQPDPFRHYDDVQSVALPFAETDPAGDHMALYGRRQAPEHLSLQSVAVFLELSLALSAWKAYGESRWSLRINPSSGNLHPTEAHLLVPEMKGLSSGRYHYNPLQHALERRSGIPRTVWEAIGAHFGTDGFLVGLTSIFWREAWKYGERAFRYCNHDVGHALAAISFAAGLLGWKTIWLNALADEDVEAALGLHLTRWPALEAEHPDLLCFVQRPSGNRSPADLPGDALKTLAATAVEGTPNRLSPQRVEWRLIYDAAEGTRKPRTAPLPAVCAQPPFYPRSSSAFNAARIIRRRRSATAFDPQGKIDCEQFFAILDKTLPRGAGPPFDVGIGEACVHLLIFVHNIEGLPRGLYLFCRNDTQLASLRQELSSDFLWESATSGLPLFLLRTGDFRTEAARLSCHQDIAGSSVFSLGMLARFDDVVRSAPHRYRSLFWETGMIGQVLYLEAEAQGARGTGIGCFFDDPVHDLAGLQTEAWQSLYHFTVGIPVEDPRLTTLPPYHHLGRREPTGR